MTAHRPWLGINPAECLKDPVASMRAERTLDTERVEAKWERLAALTAAEVRAEDEIEANLLDQLGLAQ